MSYWADRSDWYWRVIPKSTDEFDVMIDFQDAGRRMLIRLPNEPPHITFRRINRDPSR